MNNNCLQVEKELLLHYLSPLMTIKNVHNFTQISTQQIGQITLGLRCRWNYLLLFIYYFPQILDSSSTIVNHLTNQFFQRKIGEKRTCLLNKNKFEQTILWEGVRDNRRIFYLIQRLAFSNHLGSVLCHILICDILPWKI